MYAGTKPRVAKTTLYCEDCGITILTGEKYFVAVYDLAVDAEDGYGDFDEVPLCESCAAADDWLGDERQAWRHGPSARRKVAFCAKQLRKAKRFADVDWDTQVVPSLTIEELVGAILHADYELNERDREWIPN